MSSPVSEQSSFDRTLSLPADTPQSKLQESLALVHREFGLPRAMECLFRWELEVGYITRDKLENIERLSFPDPEFGLPFRIQVNYARSNYSPKHVPDREQLGIHCIICKENAGTPGKEDLRVYEFPLEGTGRSYFLQLTPFPLFAYHFVLILSEPLPMCVDRSAVEDMFAFLSMAPGFTVCSNSDVEWAGSSILEHMHFQVFRGLKLPVMEARAIDESLSPGGSTVRLLHYPLAAIRVEGQSTAEVADLAVGLIEVWKGEDPGRNTVNLVLTREDQQFTLHMFLRNPDFRTPERLTRIKSEGVGVIEASGEGIVPVPSGAEKEEIWKELKERGGEFMKDMLTGLSPIKAPGLKRFGELLNKLEKLL